MKAPGPQVNASCLAETWVANGLVTRGAGANRAGRSNCGFTLPAGRAHEPHRELELRTVQTAGRLHR